MGRLADKVRRWWGGNSGRSGVPVPFTVGCACGHQVQGLRAARHQVLRCASCAQPIFVLPYSPFPLLDGLASGPQLGPGAASPTQSLRTAHPWRLPLIAGGITLAAVVLFFVILFKVLEPDARIGSLVETKEVQALITAGEKALAEDNFKLAVQHFDEARRLWERSPGALAGAQGRRLQQLHRQADLLDRLLKRPLQEIIKEAADLRNAKEWELQFAQDYRGKSVIFDALVHRDAAGRYHLGYDLPAVELGDLKLFKNLPLDQPQRWLFGARIASIAVEPGRGWVVRFEPDSGVLVTDLGIAEACCREVLDDELREVVNRQAAELP